MAALSLMAAVENDVLIEQRARARAAAKTRAYRERRRQQAEGAA